MKILYLTNIPSPYMVDYLNELGKSCDLTAIFERSSQGDRDSSWKDYKFDNFHGIILKGINIKINASRFDEEYSLDDQAFSFNILKYIKRNAYDFIIVANPCTPTGIIAIEYMKLIKIPYVLQSEGGFPKDGKGFKEKFKKHLMSGAEIYFSTTKIDDDYFLMYGAIKDRIARYPFTSLYRSEILEAPISIEAKQRIKKMLNINYDKVILSVGRFIPIKGFDVLFKSCQNLDKNVGIYIIGGNPTEEYIKLKNVLKLENLHFIDFLSKEALKEYYLASDIFLFTTRGDTWGLVVNEAMSYGLPILTTDRCIAGLALIEDGENGYIVSVDNVSTFEEKILYLLNNQEICEKMAINNIKKMQEYTIETMGKTVIAELEAVKNARY